MKKPDPILVADRFPALRAHLLDLLAELSDDDWARPTAAPLWRVKDVAAHLLGGDLGLLSRRRDQFRMPARHFAGYSDFVAFINELNEQWIVGTRRLSPKVIRDLLSYTGPQVESYFASLDPFSLTEPVTWAGPDPAPVWLDLAREFTERWHHQQQIRDATGRPPLYDPYYFAPVLDAFMRALPHGFRGHDAGEGAIVKITISGNAGGSWFLLRKGDGWELLTETDAAPAAEVVIPQDAAWRLFTKGVRGEQARSVAAISGDSALAAPLFRTVAIIG